MIISFPWIVRCYNCKRFVLATVSFRLFGSGSFVGGHSYWTHMVGYDCELEVKK